MSSYNISTLLMFSWAFVALIPENSVAQSTSVSPFDQSSTENPSPRSPHRQWVKVYSNFSARGEYVQLKYAVSTFEHFDTYPSTIVLNDNIRSVCGVGAWIFYDHSDFTGVSELIKLNGGCSDLKTLAENVSSLRPAGDLYDFRKSTFNVYSGVNYTGANRTFGDNVSHFVTSEPHQSIIITGSLNWAIYLERGYSGYFSVCLKPVSNEYVQVNGIPEHSRDPYNIVKGYIKSIRKGCDGTEGRIILLGSGNGSSQLGLSLSVICTWFVMASMASRFI